MDNFDKIIKDKVEQFEVPYNDAHWAEMEGRLESMRIAKIKKTVLGVAAGVIGVCIAAYFLIPGNTTKSDIAVSNESVDAIEVVEHQNKTEAEVKNEASTNASMNISTPEEGSNSEEESKVAIENASMENTEVESTSSENSTTIKSENTENSTSTNMVKNEVETSQVNPDFIVFNNKVCQGEKVSFEPLTVDGPYSYTWNFGDGKISHKTNPTHTYEHSGNYDITLTILDRQTGTEHTEIKRDQVTILSSETPILTYFEEAKKHDDNKLSYPYTLFKVKNASDDCQYTWNFGNGSNSTGNAAKTIYKKEGSYTVALVAESANGCVSAIERRVTIKSGVNLFAPNALKINSTIPENAVFIPKALTEWDIAFEMTINTKDGRTIYKTSDSNEPWNGKMNNTGELMPEGMYFWQVIITDNYGVKHSYQGDIKLMK